MRVADARAAWSRRPSSAAWQLFVVVLVAYAVGAELALLLAAASGLGAVFFLPSGVTVAALLRVRRSHWWIVLLAAATGETALDILEGYSLAQVSGFVAANVAEPTVGALIVGRACGYVDLARRRHLGWFVAGAVVIGPAVGASVGAAADRLAGGDPLWSTFAQWWLGDSLGVILVGGAILAWGSSPDQRSIVSAWGAVLVGGSVLLTVGVFSLSDLPLTFLVLVGVLVAGAQFGCRAVTSTALVIACTIAIIFAVDPEGLIVGVAEDDALVLLKLQLAVFTTAGLVVAAEAFERERARESATELQARAVAEHRTVVQLQHLLLPPERQTGEHFVATGIYRAASSDLGVGGDWYDVTALPDGRVLISVGDVVGHGVEAARVMERLRIALSVFAPDVTTAGELIALLDGHVATVPGAFCTTLWVGLYVPDDEYLSYASAGHPPGFVLSAGAVDRLEKGRSTPLGVTSPAGRPTASWPISGPVTLVLYTDGLVERRGEHLDTGIDRLARALHRADVRRFQPEDIVDMVAGPRRRDDIVLLWMTLRPGAASRYPRARMRRLARRRGS